MRVSTPRRWAALGVAALALGLVAPAAQADDDDEFFGKPPGGWTWNPNDVHALWGHEQVDLRTGPGLDRRLLESPPSDDVVGDNPSMPLTLPTPAQGGGTTSHVRIPFGGDPDPRRWESVRLTFVADDGVAIYIDGQEVARSNLPDGPLTDATWATAAPSTQEARAEPVVVHLPVSVLAYSGKHILTAEVHAASPTTTDLSFQVQIALVPPVDRELIPAGSYWKYRYDEGAPPADWTTRCYLETGSIRRGPFGFGTPAVRTDFDVRPVSARPLSAYFCYNTRALYTEMIGDLQITTWANDGLVVYVNGQEVTRVNMPSGPIGPGTYATAAPWAALAYRNPVTVTVPHEVFADSDRVMIAAETHLNWRGTTDTYFDLIARSVPAGQDVTPLPTPRVSP